MKYREAKNTDAEQLATIHANSWRSTYRGLFSDDFLNNGVFENRRSVWNERLNKPSNNQLVLVAEENNKIIGFICVYGNDDVQYGSLIDNLHIKQSHKRNGIGTELMINAGEWLQLRYPENGAYLWVMEENNPAGVFYEKHGAINAGLVDKPNPVGGGSAMNCRYIWPDSTVLVSNG